jgi:hypothetical protein
MPHSADPDDGGKLALSVSQTFALGAGEAELVARRAPFELGPQKRNDNGITCVHVDERLGRVYLGRQQGEVSFWKQHQPHDPRRILGSHDGAVACILSGGGGAGEEEEEEEAGSGNPGPPQAAGRQEEGGAPGSSALSQQQIMERTESPLAGLVATGGVDATIRIWAYSPNRHGAASRCVQTLYGHVRAVTALAVWDGGVVSGSADGTVRLWRFHLQECRRHQLRREGQYQHVVGDGGWRCRVVYHCATGQARRGVRGAPRRC